MIKANFGLVASLAGVAVFGSTSSKTAADVWQHTSDHNTSFVTSERMTGDDIEGIIVDIRGDHLWAFTGVANAQFITIISDSCNQPGVVYVLDKDGKPFPEGSGFNDLTLEGVAMMVDIGAENVGKEITFVFGNYGMLAQNNTTVLYDISNDGQIDPDFVALWNSTGGQNQFGAETREYFIDGIRGVPRVKTVNPDGVARAMQAQRCCD